MSDPAVSLETEEMAGILRRRRGEALEAGMPLHEATSFATSGIDIGELRQLVGKGCPPALLARILGCGGIEVPE